MRPVYLYDTLTRRKERLEPINPPLVGIYTCGPTVYDYAHVGNLRAYVFADSLRRVLEVTGYQVRHVMNITDVGHLESDADEGEDKMVAGSRRERRTPWEIADLYTGAFLEHTAALNIKRPTVLCRATEHVPAMIAMVKTLVELGFAYEITDGVYFDVARAPGYGRLSGLDLDAQEAGARVELNPEKRHPADFALWRKAEPEHIMQWDSPWGRGYPGWHIECSAMAMEYLGRHIDIHTGGADHIPVHHENEIAQSDAVAGHPVVKRWLHNEFLMVDGGRMAKSLGNTYTLDDLAGRGYHPLAYRYFCLNAHYRTRLNFTWEALEAAARALDRLWDALYTLAGEVEEPAPAPAELAAAFLEAVTDDLALPRGLALAWQVIRERPVGAGQALGLLLEWDKVLGLSLDEAAAGRLGPAAGRVPDEVLALLDERRAARTDRDWVRADAIRDRLAEMGYAVEDGPEGPRVRRVRDSRA
ncbi:MAG: cysteine--tRNA ligase [bacterium]|nr:cysteine--tRNA ligase [bacterium]